MNGVYNLTAKQAPTPKLSQSDSRAQALDTIANLYDQLLAVENHPDQTLALDNSIMQFARLLLLGVSDLLINMPEKEV